MYSSAFMWNIAKLNIAQAVTAPPPQDMRLDWSISLVHFRDIGQTNMKALQRQTAVTCYFLSKQLLLLAFAPWLHFSSAHPLTAVSDQSRYNKISLAIATILPSRYMSAPNYRHRLPIPFVIQVIIMSYRNRTNIFKSPNILYKIVRYD